MNWLSLPYCWEAIFSGLLYFCMCCKEALTAFAPDYLFKDICMENSLERQKWCLPLKQKADLFPDQDSKNNVFSEMF